MKKGGTGGTACPGRACEAERTRRFSRVPAGDACKPRTVMKKGRTGVFACRKRAREAQRTQAPGMNPGVPIQKVCRSGRFRLLPGRFGRQTCLPRLEKFTKLRPSQKVVSGAALRQRQDTSRASVAALRNPEFRRTTLHRPYDDLNVVSQCKAGSASGAQRNTLGTHPPASPILWADRCP